MSKKNKGQLFYGDLVDRGGWLSYQGKKCEISIEPCLNGCDVAVYDLNKDLIEPKFCTNLKGFDFGEQPDVMEVIKLRAVAIDKVNEYYKRYEITT